ncbi:MAG: slipin family protein [Crenarchaeota archaeon]|nr:slipin family protein [Thermoproteota archaeon]
MDQVPVETIVGIVILLVIFLPILAKAIRVVKEWERLIVLRLGKYIGIKGPGLVFLVPFIDKGLVVDLRLLTVDVPKQEVITRDNVTVAVDAVVYFRVVDPEKAVMKVRDYYYAVALLAQTVLRDVIGQSELDDVLTKREELNKKIQQIMDEITSPWGIKVSMVTIKSVELPEELVRAMAKQAEAERLRRARIIEAEAERTAAKILGEAALVYEQHPIALRLRELQTYIDIAKERNLILVTESIAGSLTEKRVAEAIGASMAALKKKSEGGT